MKKLINNPADVVAEALLGIDAAHPELRVDHEHRVIYRADAPRPGKVGLISGGGSGHEPMHGGFVGLGMLDAACAGEIFTSPVPDQMVAATEAVERRRRRAAHREELHRRRDELRDGRRDGRMTVEVVSVVTDDDVAVTDSLYTAGRRGVGVTVLVEKIAGAAAEEGRSLADVADLARRVNGAGRSMGMALTSCTVPAAGAPTFDLPDDEMEVGIGIHGEPGRRRVPVGTAAEIADMLVAPILDDRGLHRRRRRARVRQRHGRDPADRAVRDVPRGGRDPAEVRDHGGPVAGRQLHHQPGHGRLLGDPAEGRRRAAAAVGRAGAHPGPALGHLSRPMSETAGVTSDAVDLGRLRRWLTGFADDVSDHRDLLTRLDSAIGDADHGTNLDRGMTAVVTALEKAPPPTPGRPVQGDRDDPGQHGRRGQRAALRHAVPARWPPAAGDRETLDAQAFGAILRAGLEGVVARGKAVAGDKTMFDALAPACDAFDAAVAGGAGSRPRWRPRPRRPTPGGDATIPLQARKGRASYLGERSIGHQDPGATSAALLISAAARALS